MSDLLSYLKGQGEPSRMSSDRMLLAMLLRYLATKMDEEGEPKEGTMPPATEAFKEPGVRVRPDWMPSGG